MSIQSINAEILAGGFTNDQLTSIGDAIKFARARLGEKKMRSLRIGDNVNFTSSKTGQNFTGVVMKTAIKYVTVRTVQGLWKVPASMLTLIEDKEFA
jgi:hypothetical protein